jgi:uncharacterized SAM-binding protein YcdF (DUF218 family)
MPAPIPDALLLILVPALALALAAGVTLRRVLRAERGRPAGPADAVLVFGAAARAGRASPELHARLEQAARLYRAGRAPLVLCSGGFTEGVSEAAVMRAVLVDHGVPEHALLVHEGGTSTRRSVQAAVEYGRGRWDRVLLVSSPFHMHRVATEARRQGLRGLPCPPGLTPVMRHARIRAGHRLREVAASWWYALGAGLSRRVAVADEAET